MNSSAKKATVLYGPKALLRKFEIFNYSGMGKNDRKIDKACIIHAKLQSEQLAEYRV